MQQIGVGAPQQKRQLELLPRDAPQFLRAVKRQTMPAPTRLIGPIHDGIGGDANPIRIALVKGAQPRESFPQRVLDAAALAASSVQRGRVENDSHKGEVGSILIRLGQQMWGTRVAVKIKKEPREYIGRRGLSNVQFPTADFQLLKTMQFLTRVLIVLAVLGGLGYGSYAFGKYILSARLFGPQGNAATTTASAGTLQNPSTPDAEVVPAPQKDSDDDDSPAVAAKPSATPDARVEITPADDDDDNGSARDSSGNGADPTPRPRRRRRRARPTPRPQSRPEPRESAAAEPQIAAPPAREQNVEPPSNNDAGNGSNDDSGAETPRRSDPVPAPTRRRERRTVPIPEPRNTTPRDPAPRIQPERRRESSPVPVPEGAQGGGNSSPVPVPG